VPCIWPHAQTAAHRGDDTRPPILRTLLGPAEGRHDLVVLAAGDVEDLALPVHQGGADAPRSDVDREGEVSGHDGASGREISA
jgi:hypothetical protein